MVGICMVVVINVGVVMLVVYIGVGGLGEFIFGGIVFNNNYMILVGVFFVVLMVLFFD